MFWLGMLSNQEEHARGPLGDLDRHHLCLGLFVCSHQTNTTALRGKTNQFDEFLETLELNVVIQIN